MKRVRVEVESFEGSITSGGERIPRCRKGDIIKIQDKTLEEIKEIYPKFFTEVPFIEEQELTIDINVKPDINPVHLKTVLGDEKNKPLRVLYLYMDDSRFRYDYWLRGEFIRQLPYFEPSCCVFMYGLNAHKIYLHEVPIIFDERINFKTLKDLIRPDVVLVAQKSRMFRNYHPQDKQYDTWLPSDFAGIDIPKIVIEEDYHYEADDAWYEENGINLILQRHYSQSLRKNKVSMLWFPFSVDVDIFKPKNVIKRKNKICFAGTIAPVYKYRTEAVKILKKTKLIDVFESKEKVYKKYVSNLQEYVSHISCGSIYNITPAKCFEIMASGSLLFTNRFTGINRLFPPDLYVSYKNDLSDVEVKARKILNNPEFVRTITEKALQFIREYHTHKVRAGQLLEIIRKVLG